MTTDDLVKYYQNLLILQYRSQPKARGSIDAVVRPVVMDQILLAIRDAFNLSSAVGVQLDVLGKYAGASRQQRTFSGPITLGDDDYRVLIGIKILLNYTDGSFFDTLRTLFFFFNGGIRLFDHQSMYMSVFFDQSIGSSNLAEVFVRGGFIPKPMGVQLSALIYAPDVQTKPFFGMCSYDLGPIPAVGAVGFNCAEGYLVANYHTDWPWLSYDNAV